MKCDKRYNLVTAFRLACAVGVAAAVGGLPAGAALVNKYTFNDNTANDSVGGQNGVVVDNTGIARYTGGAIDMSGNNGAGSNQDFSLPETVGAFVDLPSVTLGGGNQDFPRNESVKINITTTPFEDPILHTSASISLFPVLP